LRQEGVYVGARFPGDWLLGGLLPELSSKAQAGMEKAASAAPIRTILSDKAGSSAFALADRRAAKCVGWMIGTRLLCAASAFCFHPLDHSRGTTLHGHVWHGEAVSSEVGW
jgi:hypothetical protein